MFFRFIFLNKKRDSSFSFIEDFDKCHPQVIVLHMCFIAKGKPYRANMNNPSFFCYEGSYSFKGLSGRLGGSSTEMNRAYEALSNWENYVLIANFICLIF